MTRITNWIKGLLAVGIGLGLAGCASHAGTGALVGGGLGAATGAAIGSLSHARAGEGALIGAAVGSVAGALIGREQDNQERIRYLESERYGPPQRPRYYETRTYGYAPPPPPPSRVEVHRYYQRDACPPYHYEYRETRRYYPY